jgi:hypothetical protein
MCRYVVPYVMHLTNRSSIRDTALTLMSERLKIDGKAKFKRVSAGFLDGLEAEVLLLLKRKIANHPTIGVTLINY